MPLIHNNMETLSAFLLEGKLIVTDKGAANAKLYFFFIVSLNKLLKSQGAW